VPAGDDRALAVALRELLAPGTRQRLEGASRPASEALSWERSSETLRALLGAPPPGRTPGALPVLPELRGASAVEVLRAASGKFFSRLAGKK
jgi:hypothetical protein